MADNPEKSQKTEAPTQRRIDEARQKGNLPLSRDVSALLVLGATTGFLALFGGRVLSSSSSALNALIARPDELQIGSSANVMYLLSDLAIDFAWIAGPLMVLLLLMPVISQAVQNGLIYSTEKMKPKFERVSPIAGFKRLVSVQTLVEFVKGLLKLTAVAIAVYLAIKPNLSAIMSTSATDMIVTGRLLGRMTIDILVNVCIVLIVIAALDFGWQRYSWWRNLFMTRNELRDELRHSEGNPEIKARIRAIRRQRARRRMMAAVPQATVVITNPTHFAVALSYDRLKMRAPKCVAKGQDAVALKIKEIAAQHSVPVIENKPLARALYATVEVEEDIPAEHYKAVAEVISYVFTLRRSRV
jgi:flagellar biosynthesis protein FlhB